MKILNKNRSLSPIGIKEILHYKINLDRPAVQIIILAAICCVIVITSFSLDFVGALEKTDFDVPFYTVQLQKLILQEPTILSWPLFRVFVPALSIVSSNFLHISYRHSMQLLSLLFMVLIICFIYATNRHSPKTAFYISTFLISFPVVILYAGTYFIELPFLAFLFASLWYWDRFLHSWTKTDFGLTLLFSILGLMTKEAYLVHLVIMGLYAFVFFKSKRKIIVAVYAPMALFFIALFYFHYEYLFSIVKPVVVNPISTNTITTNFQPMGMHDIVVFFLSFRGGFIHVVINFILAFGMTHLLIAFLWKHQRPRERAPMLIYFTVLFIMLTFIAINMNTGHRYSLLCFAPSYLLLISKKITAYFHDRRLPAFCAANLVINILIVVIYAIHQHHIQ
jgi:Dolichyl-phosphate-mannose-protein mannosyltransferase